MQFITIPCQKILQPFIRNYWLLTSRCTSTMGTIHIFSNGAASLHFYLKQRVRLDDFPNEYRTLLNLNSLDSMKLCVGEGAFDVLGVEFMPFCTQLFFQVATDRQHLTPESMNDSEFVLLEERIHNATDVKAQTQMLDKFFCDRLEETSINRINMERLGKVFDEMIPTELQDHDFESISTSDLASTANLGQKQFTRIFSENVGMNPKAYLRLLRFHKALYELQSATDNTTITEIAWRCGFSDLSHMTHEFRQLCGHTPSELLAMGSRLTETFQSQFGQKMKKKIELENIE